MSGAWQAQKGPQFMFDYYISTTKDRLMPTGDAFDGDLGIGEVPLPAPPTLNREILRWLQSLDLSHSVRNIRRDAANGFLVAEICSRYFPADIQMHAFDNGLSTHVKADNWSQLKKFFNRRRLKVPDDLVDAVLKSVHGAAVELMELLFQLFTRKSVQRIPDIPEEEVNPTESIADYPLVVAVPPSSSGVPAATPGSKVLNKNVQPPNTVQFGAVHQSNVDNVAPLRQRILGSSTSSDK